MIHTCLNVCWQVVCETPALPETQLEAKPEVVPVLGTQEVQGAFNASLTLSHSSLCHSSCWLTTSLCVFAGYPMQESADGAIEVHLCKPAHSQNLGSESGVC